MNQESDKFTAEELASRVSQNGILIDEGLLANSLAVFFSDNEVTHHSVAMTNAHDNIVEAIEEEAEAIIREEANSAKDKYQGG